MKRLRIVWDADALHDLDEACDYIAAGGFAAAYCFAEDVLEAVGLLATTAVDFRRSPYGERWFERSLAPRWKYTITYTRTDKAIVVLALTSDRNEPGRWTERRG